MPPKIRTFKNLKNKGVAGKSLAKKKITKPPPKKQAAATPATKPTRPIQAIRGAVGIMCADLVDACIKNKKDVQHIFLDPYEGLVAIQFMDVFADLLTDNNMQYRVHVNDDAETIITIHCGKPTNGQNND